MTCKGLFRSKPPCDALNLREALAVSIAEQQAPLSTLLLAPCTKETSLKTTTDQTQVVFSSSIMHLRWEDRNCAHCMTPSSQAALGAHYLVCSHPFVQPVKRQCWGNGGMSGAAWHYRHSLSAAALC